jgi:cytochrome c peroxidase
MIECILRQYGDKKLYKINQSAKGNMYTFDNQFINSFDTYLKGDIQKMTKSQYNNIELFIKYADNEINDTHPDYEALVECDKYLAKIGV